MPEPYADLFTSITGYVLNKGRKPARATITMYWANTTPLEITLSGKTQDMTEPEQWKVSRNLFIAARQSFHRGAWAGGGDFAVMFTANDIDGRCMMSFQPGRNHDTASIAVLPAAPVDEFIEHTARILAPGPAETEVVNRILDIELANLLGER
jgi:hypothetical protein